VSIVYDRLSTNFNRAYLAGVDVRALAVEIGIVDQQGVHVYVVTGSDSPAVVTLLNDIRLGTVLAREAKTKHLQAAHTLHQSQGSRLLVGGTTDLAGTQASAVLVDSIDVDGSINELIPKDHIQYTS
jgi:hypothetical protein